jgi:hypothetical protein
MSPFLIKPGTMIAVRGPTTSAMKTGILLFAALASGSLLASAPADSTGLPGDGFSLEAALDMFKKSKDLESFERAINEEGNRVNNLDLNGDGKVDYVRVESHKEGNVLAIVLRVPVSEGESQDVAAIELEKTGEGRATVQIKGDEELYGPDVFAEPYQEDGGKGERGPAPPGEEDLNMYVIVNVWGWPCVQWCYGPYYDPWMSPWYWGFYPPWWHSWGWVSWGHWHHHHAHYHGWYHRVNTCRNVNANNLYMHHRKVSPTVQRNKAIRQQRAGEQRPDVQPNDRKVTPDQAPTRDRAVQPTDPQRGKERTVKPDRRQPRQPAPKPRTPRPPRGTERER